MSQTLNSSDDLEALLAELSDADLELLEEASAQPLATPVIEMEPVADKPKLKRTRKSKEAPAEVAGDASLDIELIDLDDLDDLTLDDTATVAAPAPVEAAPEPVVVEASPEPVVQPAPVDEEIDALLAAAEVEAAQAVSIAATSVVDEEPKECFVPESDLRTFLDMDKLKADLEFTETNISLAMTRQAALFAHYSTLAHQAQFQADRADQQVDLVEAQLDQKYRDAFATAGQKVTENMIKASIIKDDKYQKAMLRKHEAKAIAEMVKSAADSFRHRRDMLIQVGADLRQQAQGAVRTQEHPGQAALEALGRRA